MLRVKSFFFFFLRKKKKESIIVKTRVELPTHYKDGLRPNKPKNNEFVECGSKNWALVNQTNTGRDSDDKRMKRRKVMLKISSSEKFEEVCSFILLKSPITIFFGIPIGFSLFLQSPLLVFSFFFYTPSPFHLHLPHVC